MSSCRLSKEHEIEGMPKAPPTPERLARLLPDIPRYVETRSMLLSGSCEVLGLEKGERGGSEPSFVARELEEGEEQMIYVVGRPPSEVIDPAANNAAAIRAYEKAGFRPVGVMRRYERGPDGTWHDGLLMDMLCEESRP